MEGETERPRRRGDDRERQLPIRDPPGEGRRAGDLEAEPQPRASREKAASTGLTRRLAAGSTAPSATSPAPPSRSSSAALRRARTESRTRWETARSDSPAGVSLTRRPSR